MVRDLEDWVVGDLASAAAENVRAQTRVECNLLRIAAAWAEKHPGDGLPLKIKMDNATSRAAERRIVIVGDGCPDVAEGAAADLAVTIGRTVWQTQRLIEDALGLKYRLPLLWARVETGTVPAWQARQVAATTNGLTREQAGHVDRAITGYLGNLGWGRLKNLLDAAILRVDAAAREQAAQQAMAHREVRFGRPDDNNITTMTAGLPAPDAQLSEAGINQLADTLIQRAETGDLPPGIPVRGATTKAAWRAVALTISTSNPFLACQLLAEAQQPDLLTHLFADAEARIVDHDAAKTDPSDVDQADVDQADVDQADVDQTDVDQTDVDQADDRHHRDPIADPVRDRLIGEIAQQIDPTKLLPNVTLYVHVNAEAFLKPDDPDTQIARVEDIGPALLPTIRIWLGDGATIRLQPVLDPDGITPVDRYETPDRMRDALLARTPASVFPWTSSINRRNDLDHTIPYAPTPSGPPGRPDCTTSDGSPDANTEPKPSVSTRSDNPSPAPTSGSPDTSRC